MPGPGGKHALMGTHNRLLSLACEAFPRCYLEIIAIDPDAPAPARRRWFDLDDAAMQAALHRGPAPDPLGRARDDLAAECAAGRHRHRPRRDPGRRARHAAGLLRWRIAVRADGRRPAGGLPTLIEWGEVHPADHLAEPAAAGRIDERRLVAEIDSPKGRVRLEGLA